MHAFNILLDPKFDNKLRSIKTHMNKYMYSAHMFVSACFFPRSCLVVHATWSVIENERNKLTIFMNWGEARFAGETVRQRQLQHRILDHREQQKHNQTRARPATEPRLPPARSPETRAGKHKTRKGWSKIEWASLSKRIPVKRDWELPTDLPSVTPKFRSYTQQADELIKTTTGEKSLSHCHSNRCGHVGHRPSFFHCTWIFTIASQTFWNLINKASKVIWVQGSSTSKSWLSPVVWKKPLAYAEAKHPDLAYGTSAQYSRFSLRDTGGSLEALLPVPL